MAKRIKAYLQLTKPRITVLVILTTVAGYLFAGGASVLDSRLRYLVAASVLGCSGSAVLNQYLERDFDARMRHTCKRPIPAGLIEPVQALNFGILLVLAGVIVASVKVNLLAAFLILLTAFIYIVIYTPMKRVSWLSTSIGAISGALPPLTGWGAASGAIAPKAWILFLILFLWQHPHFYAIGWMYREDYATGGFKILSVIDSEGRRAFRHILIFTLLLVPVSVLPYVFGLSGIRYGVGSLLLGIMPLVFSVKLFFSRSDSDTRSLFKATLAYLPALMIVMILDSVL
ncbi:heme o synthase [Chlorobaculum sp. MV4-Y]|uniref:heme o synthase n=1 Tax=Chlorobaculum sp. MV4-Y TaxID=2976335 RepID=UPI0021AF9105|nr:heme o synthase [Chlorobaculum sp. MV4-Y]UWX58400.1 heme o synthase [Chlorobaculum sp. MV4-Y]